MALVPRSFHKDYSIVGKKWGDVEKEREVEERMKELGLYDNKKNIESQLVQRLSSAIDEDTVMGAVNRNKRRQRPLSERMQSVVTGIKDVIRQKVIRDSDGRKVLYQVDILLGQFTKDVQHQAFDHVVLVTGTVPNGAKLTKEIRVEFPDNVEMAKLAVSYSAGVFKMEVPFCQRASQRQLCSSSNSEESMSFTSETDSDVFTMSPEPD